jgi:probable rRNA maturation factor
MDARAADHVDLDLQIAVASADNLPDEAVLRHWIALAVGEARPVEITLRIVTAAESQQLNRDYRGVDKPTNVLSFPADLPPEVELPLLGDLVICREVVEREAAEQDKPLSAHWAHLVIHGTLHLLGYDHIEERDAEVMEMLEISLLAALGYTNPYE